MAEAGDNQQQQAREVSFREVPLDSDEAMRIQGQCPSGMKITAIEAVVDRRSTVTFEASCNILASFNDGKPNIINGFHCSRGNLKDIISGGGLKITATQGNMMFGAGIYFGTPTKANSYSPPSETRTMLMCSVVLGKCKEFKTGTNDIKFNLKHEKEGFDSSAGFFKTGKEWCVYNPYHQKADYIIHYKIEGVISDEAPIYQAGQKIVYITPILVTYIGTLRTRCGNDKDILKNLDISISQLLTRKITPEKFCNSLSDIFKSVPPPGFLDKLKTELAKCTLSQPVASQPVASQPVASQPVVAQPVASQPVASQPVVAQPVASQPVASQPVASQPVASQPVVAQPVVAQPVHFGRASLEGLLSQARSVLSATVVLQAHPSQLVRMESVAGDLPSARSCRPPKRGESEAQADSDEEERPSKRGLRRM
jgi:hypothetical protein